MLKILCCQAHAGQNAEVTWLLSSSFGTQTRERKVLLCCWCWSGEGSWLLRAECKLRSWEGPSAVCTQEDKVRHKHSRDFLLKNVTCYWISLAVNKTFTANFPSRIISVYILSWKQNGWAPSWNWKLNSFSNLWLVLVKEALQQLNHQQQIYFREDFSRETDTYINHHPDSCCYLKVVASYLRDLDLLVPAHWAATEPYKVRWEKRHKLGQKHLYILGGIHSGTST